MVGYVVRLVAVAMLATASAAKADTPVTVLAQANPSHTDVPTFLPRYFLPAMTVGDTSLRYVEHGEKDKVQRWHYQSANRAINLIIEALECEFAVCKPAFDNGLVAMNKMAADNAGEFGLVTEADLRLTWASGGQRYTAMGFRTPRSMLFWTYTIRPGAPFDADKEFQKMEPLVNRLRYETAYADGNVEMGRWNKQILHYARAVLAEGRKADAIVILRNLLATAPTDYEAHIDFTAIATNATEARTSAQVVYDNAEDPALLAKAERALIRVSPRCEDLPPLTRRPGGLRVVIVALPPCDARIIREGAAVYEKALNIPVEIVRFQEAWQWGEPQRIAEQRAIRQAIVQHRGPTVDFTGWGLEQYRRVLLKTAEGKDPLSRYWTQHFVREMATKPGQFDAEILLPRFLAAIAPYAPQDRRTMFVGVSEANIFAGDVNYLFSVHAGRDGVQGSLMSYSMMLAKTLRDPQQSRKRLAERLAKELVPSSFKSLGIPRPADPSDPYSYSDGVGRLDQKSLVLSLPTQTALDRFRQ